MAINKINRVYVDSSAVGGVFNDRIAVQTKPFWNAVERGEIVVIISDVLTREAEKAPQCVRNFLATLSDFQIERVIATEEAKELAARYIEENVVGPTCFDDCLHIALGTIHRADYLVSWNFKHIVNVKRIHGYNGINMKLGYPQIEIRTPYEVINDET